MPRKKYELCPRCNEKKVSLLADGEHKDVKKELHNYHVIHAPYSEYRVWLCGACGWTAAVRWHADNYNPKMRNSVYALLVVDEPEPEFETNIPVFELDSADDNAASNS